MASANNHLKQFRDIVAQRFATKVVEDRSDSPPKPAPPQIAMAK
jgi:hypothetical protein